MRKWLLFALLMMICLVACEPGQIVISGPENDALNANPDLVLGMCADLSFPTKWGDRWLVQCVPAGYALYENPGDVDGDISAVNGALPVDVDYTGVEYSLLVGGRSGEIGFTMPETFLSAGCYVAKMSGFLHVWGRPDEYTIQAFIDDAGGRLELNIADMPANGHYEVVFAFLVDGADDVTVTVYFNFDYATATADSYATIKQMELIAVSDGHCLDAP